MKDQEEKVVEGPGFSDKVCIYCDQKLIEDAGFCHECGGIIEEKSAEELLDIKLDSKDIQSLVLSGYVEKDIPISEDLTLTIRTMTMAESVESKLATDVIVNGRPVAEDTYQSIKTQEDMKYILKSINGKEPPKKLSPSIVAIAIQKSYLLHSAMNQKIQEGKIKDF